MTKERFWVVGGEYSCLAFTKLKNGAPQVLGPYESRDEAKQAWAKVSEETRSQATMRFAIAALSAPNESARSKITRKPFRARYAFPSRYG